MNDTTWRDTYNDAEGLAGALDKIEQWLINEGRYSDATGVNWAAYVLRELAEQEAELLAPTPAPEGEALRERVARALHAVCADEDAPTWEAAAYKHETYFTLADAALAALPAPTSEQEGLREAVQKALDAAEADDQFAGPWGILETLCRRLRAALTADADPEQENKWLVQDTRSIVGNSMMWWKKDGKGYSSDIRDAELMTLEQARRLVTNHGHFRAYPAAYIAGLARPHVDFQYVDLSRSLTPERTGQEAEREGEG